MYNTHISFGLTSLCSQVAHVNATKLEFLQEEKLSRSHETYANARARKFDVFPSHLHFLLDAAAENSAVGLYGKERERMIAMVGVRGG